VETLSISPAVGSSSSAVGSSAMRIAVTGSIATDHLMVFPGRFADQLLPDQLHRISLSFLVDKLEVRRGGVGANICFGLASLGLRPALVGAVGIDFDEYRSWLDRAGVDVTSVHASAVLHTARFVCTTDSEQNQIASFYPGAMSEAREIELSSVVERLGALDLVLISPNDPAAMTRHTHECRELGIAFLADPSQQLSSMGGEQVRDLVAGATYLFTNEYEKALVENKTGWSDDEVLAQVGVRVTTLGADGAIIEQAGEPAIKVAAVAGVTPVDPTGGGDAFRAGFVAGLAWGVGLERCAQIGSLLAAYVLETVGTQEYRVTADDFSRRFTQAFGADAAAQIEPHLATTAT
jgi:adenosine kinase